MIRAISICVLFYLALFLPSFFSPNVALLVIFLIVLICLNRVKELSFLILEIILLFLLFSDGSYKTAIDISLENNISGIYCKVLAEPSFREKRNKGYKAELVAIRDKSGTISSAKGVIYAITKDSDVHIFDYVYLSGEFCDSLFISDSTEILKRCRLSRERGRIIDFVRARTRNAECGNLMQLLLLGSGEDTSADILELSSVAGLRHILALSGMHLSIILALLRPLMGNRWGSAISYIFLFFFLWLSGWKASLMRAFLFLLSIRIFKDLYFSFSLSAILLLFLFPYYGYDLGAIYSFVALSGIIAFSNKLEKLLPKSAIISSFCVSISAQSASVMISYSLFGSYQLLSILFSYPASFFISIFMGLSFMYLAFPSIEPVLDILYKLIERVFILSSLLPPSTTLAPYFIMIGSIASIIIVKALIVVSPRLKRNKKR